MTIGENIKQRRKELGLSQLELSILCGYKERSTIAGIESGRNDIPRAKLELFAKALKCSVADIEKPENPCKYKEKPHHP